MSSCIVFAQGHAERFPALASELVSLPVDVIVSWGTPASLAAQKATDTIPIVMSAGDPIGAGIVAGLARPGGNITGISVQMAEQEGKRLELLKKLLPSFSRVAVLSNPSNPYCAIAVGEARRGATALNLQFDLLDHLVGAHKERFRDRQPDRLCRLVVDHQLKLGGLLLAIRQSDR